jgi:RecA/RadA recombinase
VKVRGGKTPESAGRARVGALEAVAARFKGFRPAREVLKVVRAVPTRFVQFDHATRVGGLPIERFMLLHGKSNEGKSLMALGLVDSFVERGHVALYIDAERTTPITWARDLLGANADAPTFFAEKPETYEKTIGRVREFLNVLAEEKAKGKLPPETSALVVVDSLRKLVPADLMKEIIRADREDHEGGITAGRDRRGQLQAKMNAAWMDELVPLLDHAGAAFVAIAREMVDPEADVWAKRRGDDYKVGGGGAIYYDASLSMRVERASWVTHGEGREAVVYGERHRVTIKKTKVAGKDGKVVVCHFHSSNGKLVAPGFDRARDVVDLGAELGVVKVGSTTRWGDKRSECVRGGAHAAVRALSGDPAALAALEAKVRERFPHKPPVEHDPVTGEVG